MSKKIVFFPFNWENHININYLQVYKILNSLVPPPLKYFIKKNISNTRGGSRGDCVVPFRKTVFGQSLQNFCEMCVFFNFLIYFFLALYVFSMVVLILLGGPLWHILRCFRCLLIYFLNK